MKSSTLVFPSLMILSKLIAWVLSLMTLPSSALLFVWYFEAQASPVDFVFAPVFITSLSVTIVLVTCVVITVALLVYREPQPSTLAILAILLFVLGFLQGCFAVDFAIIMRRKASNLNLGVRCEFCHVHVF